MPFDPVIGFNTDPQYKASPFLESEGTEFVPDIHHLRDDLVLLSDSSVLAMIRLPGFPFELESMRARNIRRRQINDIIRGLSDSNVTLSFHLCHHAHVGPFKWGRFRSRFTRRLFQKYEQNCLAGLMANDWLVTVIASPRFTPVRAARRKLAVFGKRFGGKPPSSADPGVIRQSDGIMQALMAYFSQAGARRLGYRDDPERGWCSEIAEMRRLIITGRWQAVPLTNGLLASAIYTDRVICGTRAIRIEHMDGPHFAKVIALRDYPSEDSYTGQFSHLVQVSAKDQHTFVLAQTMRFLSREGAGSRLYLKLTRMANAFDSQKRGMAKLEEAKEEVASGETVRGNHNFALAVFAPTMAGMYRAAGIAGNAINKGGGAPIVEDGGSFGAFWSMLPGNPDWLEGRSGGVSARNLTAFASLEGYPTGAEQGHWGPAVVRFATSGCTAYDWVSHVGDIGHALFIGRSSSGKTLTMNLLCCALEQAYGPDDRIFYFDKDQGAEPACRAIGGAYLTLKSGAPSGLAPLRGFPDTPGSRAALEQLIAALMLSDGRGPLQSRTTTMLHRAVARQMRLPPGQRRMGAVRAFLGYGEGSDGERLDRWCWGGADGWLFDGEEDHVRTDAPFVGFDLTQLFDHPACPHVAFYLFARIRELIDGRRITVIADEVRAYLLSPQFADFILDFSFTLRKKNGQLWLAGQEPAHIINSQIGSGLANQAQTMWLFPARNANPDEYQRLGCTQPMYRAVTETMPTLGYRSVLLKRDGQSAILRTELTDMEDEIAVLSGREETVRMIPDILAETGDDPDAFTDVFIRRCAASAQARERQGDSALKTRQLAVAIGLAAALHAMPARAQIATFDAASVLQLVNQLQQLKQQYQATLGVLGSLERAVDPNSYAAALRMVTNPMPQASQMSQLISGSGNFGTLGTLANQFLGGNTYYRPTSTGSNDFNASIIQRAGNTLAGAQAMAQQSMASIESHIAGLNTIQSQLSVATSSADLAAIQGRLQAEHANLAAQSVQAQSISTMLAAQQQQYEQMQIQRQRQDADQLAASVNGSGFGGTAFSPSPLLASNAIPTFSAGAP